MNRFIEAVANSEELSAKSEELGITRRKIFEYLGLFFFLSVTYLICISSYIKFLKLEPSEGYGFGDVLRPLVPYCLLSALPFAVLAYSDKNWRSSDAARVICSAWAAVYFLLSFQLGHFCPMGALIPLFPFTLSALLANRVGKFCQPREHDDMNSTRRR
jgi:hypothetical protein